MICRNCKTYYVRAPCPSCGDDPAKDKDEVSKLSPSQIRERESHKEIDSGSQVLVTKENEDERLVRPSERFKQERQEDEDLPSFQRIDRDDEGERLVKPSDRLRQRNEEDDDLPSFKKFDSQTDTVKAARILPSTPQKKEEEVPTFMKFEKDRSDMEELAEISQVLGNKEQQTKLKNDKQYRSKVKETLEEVVGLLERLIEDD